MAFKKNTKNTDHVNKIQKKKKQNLNTTWKNVDFIISNERGNVYLRSFGNASILRNVTTL